MLSGQQDAADHAGIGVLDRVEDDEGEDEPASHGRPRRTAQKSRVKAKTPSGRHTEGYDSLGSMDDESDATSSGNEWDGGDEDEPDDHVDDEEEDEDVDMSDNSVAEEEDDNPRQSLVVTLRHVKSRPSPPSQDTRIGLAISEDHSKTPVTTSNPEGLSETAHSTDGLTKSLNDTPNPTPSAAPAQYSKSAQKSPPFHHAVLAEPAVLAQYVTPTDPRPQAADLGQSTSTATEKEHTLFRPKHSHPEEHPLPTASWPRPETGVIAPNGTQM